MVAILAVGLLPVAARSTNDLAFRCSGFYYETPGDGSGDPSPG